MRLGEAVRTAAGDLGAFAAGLDAARLPGRVLDAVRGRLLDFAGVAMAGQAVDRVQPWIAYAARLAGRAESTVIGRAARSSAFGAALANGVSSGALELDDGHLAGHVHPGGVVIAAALAVAERDRRPAADLLAGIVAGYEVNIRLGEALTDDTLYARGFNLVAMAGAFAAAAAAARTRGLTHRETAHALGHAALAPVAPMISFQQGAMTRDGYWGWPAALGVLAADLAAAGVTGPAGVFEDRWGVLHAVAGGGNRARLTDRLGDRWTILETYTKIYAACSHAQTALDAASEAAGGRHDPAAIERVVVDTYAYAAALRDPAPTTPAGAQFSLPFCLAVLLTRGRVDPEAFAPDGLTDAGVRALASRVDMREDASLEARHRSGPYCRPSRVTVRFAGGEERTAYREAARGWPEAPLTRAELLDKYAALTRRVMPAKAAGALASAIEALGPGSGLGFIRHLAGRAPRRARSAVHAR